jgi:hypothetical protein
MKLDDREWLAIAAAIWGAMLGTTLAAIFAIFFFN